MTSSSSSTWRSRSGLDWKRGSSARSARPIALQNRRKMASLLAPITTEWLSRVVYVLDGAVLLKRVPLRWRTTFKRSNSGTLLSSRLNTASYSAMSTSWPRPPLWSRWWSAMSAPSAA